MKRAKTNPNDTYNWKDVREGINCPDCRQTTSGGSTTQWRADGTWAWVKCACGWNEWRKLVSGKVK
jgi:hypothetical protein